MAESGPLTLVLLFLGAFVFPQAVGVPALRWAFRKQRRIILVSALLVAPAVFFTTATIYWGMRAEAIRAEGHYVCGALGAAAFFSTVWGTSIHLVISIGARVLAECKT
jgi:hypothetical protein